MFILTLTVFVVIGIISFWRMYKVNPFGIGPVICFLGLIVGILGTAVTIVIQDSAIAKSNAQTQAIQATGEKNLQLSGGHQVTVWRYQATSGEKHWEVECDLASPPACTITPSGSQ